MGKRKFKHTKPDDGPPKQRVRVLLVDDMDRVYLVQSRDRDDMQHVEWQLPGGKFEGDEETQREAARRELKEESGYTPGKLYGPIWVCESRKRGHDREDWIYVAYLTRDAKPGPKHHSKTERKTLIGERWWTLAEMQKSTERFRPHRLPELYKEFLDQGEPRRPRRISE